MTAKPLPQKKRLPDQIAIHRWGKLILPEHIWGNRPPKTVHILIDTVDKTIELSPGGPYTVHREFKCLALHIKRALRILGYVDQYKCPVEYKMVGRTVVISV